MCDGGLYNTRRSSKLPTLIHICVKTYNYNRHSSSGVASIHPTSPLLIPVTAVPKRPSAAPIAFVIKKHVTPYTCAMVSTQDDEGVAHAQRPEIFTATHSSNRTVRQRIPPGLILTIGMLQASPALLSLSAGSSTPPSELYRMSA